MNESELIEFVKNNKDNYSIQLKRKYPQIYDKINEDFKCYDKFSEKLYRFINKSETIGKCEICNNPCKFDGIHVGYRKRCSYKCLNSLRIVRPIKKTCPTCGKIFETDKRHDRLTCSDECKDLYLKTDVVLSKKLENQKSSVNKKKIENPNRSIEISEKRNKTRLEKYGNENFVNVEKSKQSRLEKYGDANYNNIKKYRETMMYVYGVDNISQVEGISDKVNKTKFDRFGEQMISDSHLKILKDNIESGKCGYGCDSTKKTNIDRYGFPVASMNKDVMARIISTQHDKFYDEMIRGDRLKNKSIPMFNRDEYIGTRDTNGTPIHYKFKCSKCENVFDGVIEDGKIPRCYTCDPQGRSKSENEVYEFIRNLLTSDIIVSTGVRNIISPLELDIYIPSKKLAIEFDGIIWHSEHFGEKSKKYHLNKTIECDKLGIKLIHIFENEWLYKKDIIKRKLKNLLNIRDVKSIYARNCEIREITSKESIKFLRENHIQGSDRSSVKFGAFYNETLVSVMTFGGARIALGSKVSIIDEYEMYRFCVGEIPVTGIAGKLLSYFIKKYNPSKITTFADIRYSGMNAMYDKIGFTHVNNTAVGYHYFNCKTPMNLKHRYNFRKSELHKKLKMFDSTLTEWENMKNNGYDRIWDCGNLKYEWKKQDN